MKKRKSKRAFIDFKEHNIDLYVMHRVGEIIRIDGGWGGKWIRFTFQETKSGRCTEINVTTEGLYNTLTGKTK